MRDVSFSPDGGEVAFTTGAGGIAVHALGGGPTRRLAGGTGPVWGPQAIAFHRGAGLRGDVWTVRPGSEPIRLTRTHAGVFPVAWSADGTRLLAANPAMHNGRLWAVDAPSGNARPLTDWRGDLYGQGISYDGRTVLAAIGCGGMIGPAGVVETIPFAGGKPTVVVKGPCRASWNE